MRALVVGLVLVASCGVAAAQDGDAIEVDRPDVTNSTATVGAGLFQGLASSSLGREVATSLSAFVELFRPSPDERDGRHALGADAGVVWTLTRDVAVDVALAPSLKGPLPDYALRTGASVRFGP